MKQEQELAPRFGRIDAAVARSGVSRSRIYEWGRRTPGLIVKNGSSSLVNFEIFDQLLDALPPAKLKGASDEN
jgi:hypothetical protein